MGKLELTVNVVHEGGELTMEFAILRTADMAEVGPWIEATLALARERYPDEEVPVALDVTIV